MGSLPHVPSCIYAQNVLFSSISFIFVVQNIGKPKDVPNSTEKLPDWFLLRF
jgi:hypothetical protein